MSEPEAEPEPEPEPEAEPEPEPQPEEDEARPQPDERPRRFYMDKPEEVADAQERYRRASTPPAAAPSTPTTQSPAGALAAPPIAAELSAPPAASSADALATPPAVAAPAAPRPASPAARPASPAPALVDARVLQRARLATAGAALALAVAFFYPAIRDAIDGPHRLGPDGRPLPPAAAPRMYLLVDATPRGATVLLDGEDAGNTPLATNVECVDGAQVRVEITAPGHVAYSAVVPCTPGGNADLSPTLKRDATRR